MNAATGSNGPGSLARHATFTCVLRTTGAFSAWQLPSSMRSARFTQSRSTVLSVDVLDGALLQSRVEASSVAPSVAVPLRAAEEARKSPPRPVLRSPTQLLTPAVPTCGACSCSVEVAVLRAAVEHLQLRVAALEAQRANSHPPATASSSPPAAERPAPRQEGVDLDSFLAGVRQRLDATRRLVE